ncbi:efflux RND transporter periplasmic adaptor subunit [uncultured Polaribacter sp.]|uniref:efflux RND transporter periplasmic adaptor subunit n=1 Tax=uncultured Polaribacter sp. TaxID=174711 RepID=UPI002630C235|nr:efflux RND transporter periplasmic adaptor subunit [uncultured Polaribacter sp.]
MKKIYLLLITAFVLNACGDKKEPTIAEIIASKDIKKIRTKKSELDKKQQELSDKVKTLISAIDELDTLKRNPLVTAFTIKNEKFIHYLELQGNVQTKQNVLVYPEMPGTLERVFVKEGQRVSKGQILAKIDDGGMAQQVAQLEATTALAQTTFERQKRLWAQKIGSEIQYLQAETQFKSQKNALAQLKKQLDKASIRAPFSGIVDAVMKEQGTVVAPGPGSEVFRVINLNNMYLETDVPEAYIGNVSKGKSVIVTLPILGKTINTVVRQTGNYINPTNRTFKIEVGVPNTDKSIKPNLTAKLSINDYTSENAILIPQSVISENAVGKQYVYVIKNKEGAFGIAKQVIVETGKIQGDKIEILSGIKTGDQLIEAGARSVKDGQKVEIRG